MSAVNPMQYYILSFCIAYFTLKLKEGMRGININSNGLCQHRLWQKHKKLTVGMSR
jgi:hypothetical protein